MSTGRTEQRVSSKTASTRLLDLLAGWSAYVSADEANNVQDPALSAEEIGALYQLAGELSEVWDKLSSEGQAEAITTFVQERILPVILWKPTEYASRVDESDQEREAEHPTPAITNASHGKR